MPLQTTGDQGKLTAFEAVKYDRVTIETVEKRTDLRQEGQVGRNRPSASLRDYGQVFRKLRFSSLKELPEIEDIEGAIGEDSVEDDAEQISMEEGGVWKERI